MRNKENEICTKDFEWLSVLKLKAPLRRETNVLSLEAVVGLSHHVGGLCSVSASVKHVDAGRVKLYASQLNGESKLLRCGGKSRRWSMSSLTTGGSKRSIEDFGDCHIVIRSSFPNITLPSCDMLEG